jgi:hypothetical protein
MRSRAPGFFFFGLSSFVALSLAAACGVESVTIPDPEVPETSVLPDAGATDGTTASETSITDGAPDADVTCADVLPDDTTGIYVTPTGTNSTTCGTRVDPCKTITVSVVRAGSALRTKVYAARGTYVEKVPLAAGVEVIGGWDVTGTTWKRACVDPEDIVVVRAPVTQNITVEARDIGGEARLSMLKIESKAVTSVVAGESLYGVVAVGQTTTLVMTDVNVDLGPGGAGAAGIVGTAGAAGAASCPVGTGTPGTAGTPGTGAPAGTFDPTNEYTPAQGTGGNATATAGGDGTTAGGAGTCVQCGTCALSLTLLSCDFTPDPAGMTCGNPGTTGCGGLPGGPGAAASGGGASVGVFAWDASVTINGGNIKSGDGGNGGVGGTGGTSGTATKGAAGTNAALCTTSCLFAAGACTDVKSRGIGGVAGSAGALGGVGGAGGGGGGGSSFAIYQGGAGVVTTGSGATLAHGKAGAGGGPATALGAAGAAADRVP